MMTMHDHIAKFRSFFRRCILLKDTSEYRHYKTLKRAYIGVKLAHERAISNQLPASESASAKTYQAIKCKRSSLPH